MSALIQRDFDVQGMHCGSCAAKLSKQLSSLPGVVEAQVNYATANARISYAPEQLNSSAIAAAVTAAGYQPALQSQTLSLQNLRCASCVNKIQQTLLQHPEVVSAEVNLALGEVHISSLGELQLPAILTELSQLGYPLQTNPAQAEVATTSAVDSAETPPITRQPLFWALVLSAPFVLQMLLMPWHLDMPGWLQWGLASVLQFYIGRGFYQRSWQALRHATGSMDLLVALGTSAAYFFSVYQLWQGAHGLYFEASSLIISLVLLGRWMEEGAKRGTTQALQQLMALQPASARLLKEGQEQQVPIAQVQLGDILLIKPGDRVPVDAEITAGVSELDESLVTGESLPQRKQVGDVLLAGSHNQNGRLEARATAVGHDSTLSRIVQLVRNAQQGKAPMQRLVDKVSSLFVGVVLVLALTTLLAWLWLGADLETAIVAAVAVLVIACPCALGLASPTAMLAGTGAAARAGILLRDMESVERARRIDSVIFDKTGTLTANQPQVVAYQGDSDSLRLAASLQQGNQHPLGSAILHYAQNQALSLSQPENLQVEIGAGIRGLVAGRCVAVGNERLFEPAQAASLAARFPLSDNSTSQVFVAVDEQICAAFSFADQPRPEARAAIAALRTMGLSSMILSGDSERATQQMLQSLHMDHGQWRLRPEDKLRVIHERQYQGQHLAMVGDGINDAPALAAADIGIAMGSGTQVAMETAGITLLRADLMLVPAALQIARATARKIRQNLFWAFAYNVIAIPLAALGYLNPVLAGAAMALSSVSVVSNSWLLSRWQAPKAARHDH